MGMNIFFEMIFCVILGEAISGSEGSGSDEIEQGDDDEADAGDGHTRRRGKIFNSCTDKFRGNK